MSATTSSAFISSVRLSSNLQRDKFRLSSKISGAFKNAAKKLIGLYLYPLRSNPKVFHQVKGIYFLDPSEHLYRTTKHIDRLNLSGEELIIDVGGAHGTVTQYFTKHYPNFRFCCVEANPRLRDELEQKFSANKKVTVKSMALGSVAGEEYLHVTANQLSSSLHNLNADEISVLQEDHRSWLQEVEKIKVNVSTLDDEFKDEPGVLLIKLDTQGTEKDILTSGIELLKRTRFVLTEMNNHKIYDDACQYHEVDEFLRSRSFRLVDLIVSYYTNEEVQEYDALYENTGL
jgi:FkbM family methyltransferase